MSNQIKNIIIFAADKATAELRKKELCQIVKGFNILGAYHDIKFMKAENKYEGDAIYIVDIQPECKDIPKYIKALEKDAKRVTFIISDNKNHEKQMIKLKIKFIKSPINPYEILELLNRKLKEKPEDEEEIQPIPENASKYKLEKNRLVSSGKGKIFKTENGNKLYDTDKIKKIYSDEVSNDVYAVFNNGKEVKIIEIINDAADRLRISGFEMHNSHEMLNLAYIIGFSSDNKTVFMENESYPVEPDQVIDLHLAWINFSNLPIV